MRQVEDQGFETIPDVFKPAVMSSVISALQQADLQRSRAGIRNVLRIPAVTSLASDPGLISFAKAVLGKNAVPFRATLFDKSPGSNWLVVWHQDTALPLRERRDVPGWGPWSVKEGVICAHAPADALEQIFAIRVHLDDSTGDNGPLRVLPGSHNSGVLSDDRIHDLTNKIAPRECQVEAGGILLMRPLLVHASSKANTSAPRRVLHIEYAADVRFAGQLELAMC